MKSAQLKLLYLPIGADRLNDIVSFTRLNETYSLKSKQIHTFYGKSTTQFSKEFKKFEKEMKKITALLYCHIINN